MLIYQGTAEKFRKDVIMNRISDIMYDNYRESYNKKVGKSEFHSWQNSLHRVSDVLEVAGLKDNYVALEFTIPYNSSRIDCLIFGRDIKGEQNIMLIELKQWEHVTATSIEGNYVETYTGGGERIVPHPSQQVKDYHNYLLDFVEEFEKSPFLNLTSCAYCHNYSRKDQSGLLHTMYRKILDEYPVYCKEDVEVLAERLKIFLGKGEGTEIFNRFMQSRIRPSKKLLNNVKNIVKNGTRFSLLNEQLVAKNLIMSKMRKAEKNGEKSIVLVKGGPGTGKSIIALNIMAEIAGRNKPVLLVSKSKPFRDGLQSFVGGRARNMFVSPYSLTPSRMQENSLDALLVDEAHRLEYKNIYRMMRAKDRSEKPMIEQLIRTAKTSVFFIDDKQRVRSQEIGNSGYIKNAASKLNYPVEEVELESQFRCMGSNNYIEWIESVLGYTEEKKYFEKTDLFDFRIFDTPADLYEALSEKEKEKPNSARLTAGYCWPWSDPNPDGTLVNDVKIGNFAMPWETKGDRPVGIYPAWYQWAYKPNGFKQVGCIYTAQGFEFDYIGVIIGPDLYYDKEYDRLSGKISKTQDPTLRRDPLNFETYVKNIYRVLLTRGMKGCYVYFVDKGVEGFVRKFLEK